MPARVGQLENDAEYLTGAQAEASYVKTSVFEDLASRVDALERSGG